MPGKEGFEEEARERPLCMDAVEGALFSPKKRSLSGLDDGDGGGNVAGEKREVEATWKKNSGEGKDAVGRKKSAGRSKVYREPRSILRGEPLAAI